MIRDYLARRVDGELHVKGANDVWWPVESLGGRLISVYSSVQPLKGGSTPFTTTIHAVVDVPSDGRPSVELQFALSEVKSRVERFNSADLRLTTQQGPDLILHSATMDCYFRVKVEEVKLP